MNQRLIALARYLQPSVGRLDALVVAISGGGVDGHGEPIAPDAEARQRLIEAMANARQAIEGALLQINAEPKGVPHALQPGN